MFQKTVAESRYLLVVSYATLVYLAIFSVVSFFTGNSEFFLYTITVGFIVLIGLKNERKIRINLFLSERIVIGISMLGFLALLGGIVRFESGAALNSIWIVRGFLKYQDITHLLFTFVMVLTSYAFLKPYLLNERLVHSVTGRSMLHLTLILIVTGIGSTIEVVEFFASTFLGSSVGTYESNALDLLFNLLGALIGVLFLPLRAQDEPLAQNEPPDQ